MMPNRESKTSTQPPPYLSYKTFTTFLENLHESGVPHQIDRGVMHKLSGAYQNQMLSAFRFLGLIDGPNHDVTGRLEELVAAQSVESERIDALKGLLLPCYDEICGDLDVTKSTNHLIREKFREYGVDGQMLDRAITFYINLLSDAKVPFSPHMKSKRQKRTANGSKRRVTTKSEGDKGRSKGSAKGKLEKRGAPLPQHDMESMIELTVPFGDVDGIIRVPRNIRSDQIPVFKALVDAVERLAELNSENGIE